MKRTTGIPPLNGAMRERALAIARDEHEIWRDRGHLANAIECALISAHQEGRAAQRKEDAEICRAVASGKITITGDFACAEYVCAAAIEGAGE